jgi:ATP-dependent helicase HrpA
VILRMLALGLGASTTSRSSIRPTARGRRRLAAAGRAGRGRPNRRTADALGRQMARLPVDVKLARMLVAARDHGCCARCWRSPRSWASRTRASARRGARGRRHRARAVRRPRSEFVGILKLWEAYQDAHEDLTQSKLRDWCERIS